MARPGNESDLKIRQICIMRQSKKIAEFHVCCKISKNKQFYLIVHFNLLNLFKKEKYNGFVYYCQNLITNNHSITCSLFIHTLNDNRLCHDTVHENIVKNEP